MYGFFFPAEIGRLKVSIPERNLEFFQSLGPLGPQSCFLRAAPVKLGVMIQPLPSGPEETD